PRTTYADAVPGFARQEKKHFGICLANPRTQSTAYGPLPTLAHVPLPPVQPIGRCIPSAYALQTIGYLSAAADPGRGIMALLVRIYFNAVFGALGGLIGWMLFGVLGERTASDFGQWLLGGGLIGGAIGYFVVSVEAIRDLSLVRFCHLATY